MMDGYLLEWMNLLVRWLHFITGIAWIGSSLYFIWLDNHLGEPRAAADRDKGVGGELWSVHGGGFYHAQKYQSSPSELPAELHWFKWEAYSTWLSGMFLLGLVYFVGAEVYLIDRSVADISVAAAIGIAIAIIATAWLVYDQLCKSPLAKSEPAFAIVLLILCGFLAWGLCALYSGRAAYILFGAVLGTIMVANVFFVIIPGQKSMVAAVARGETPDPAFGSRGKLRSVHNTYFTLPVLFVMTSNHYAMTYNHRYNWLILTGIALAGALIRIYFVARHKGTASRWPAIAAVLLLAGIAFAMAPRDEDSVTADVSFAEVESVIVERCASCHSATPDHPAFPSAPMGVILDTAAQIRTDAERIYQQTVVTRVMPIGNLTAMTDEERELIRRWYHSLEGTK